MGLFLSCCKESSDAILPHPDAETRRQQQAEAAERRMKENAAKGIKNPERVRQMEKKAEELERLERENAMKGAGGAPLRVSMLFCGKKPQHPPNPSTGKPIFGPS